MQVFKVAGFWFLAGWLMLEARLMNTSGLLHIMGVGKVSRYGTGCDVTSSNRQQNSIQIVNFQIFLLKKIIERKLEI